MEDVHIIYSNILLLTNSLTLPKPIFYVLYIVGLHFLIFGASMIYEFHFFYERKGIKTTEAKVVRLNVEKEEKRNMYNPVFQYQTDEGRQYEYNCQYNFTSEKPLYSEGETVTVYYLPSSPNEVRPKIQTDFTVVAISFCILGLIPMVFANYEFCNERKEAALLKQDAETAFLSIAHNEGEQNQMETATNIPPQYFYLKLLSESGFHYLLLIASFLATLLSYFTLFFILIKLGVEDVWVCGGLSFFFTIGFNFYCITKIVNVFSPVFVARADGHGLVFKTFNRRSKDESYSWNNLHQFGFKLFKGGSFTAIDWLNEYDHTFKYCGIHHVKLYNWLRTYFPEKEKI